MSLSVISNVSYKPYKFVASFSLQFEIYMFVIAANSEPYGEAGHINFQHIFFFWILDIK